jgi:hypothetical protein
LDALHSFAAWSKISHDFSNKEVLKLKLPKKVFLNSFSLLKKISMKIYFESPILALFNVWGCLQSERMANFVGPFE